jgi:hypothetical protein
MSTPPVLEFHRMNLTQRMGYFLYWLNRFMVGDLAEGSLRSDKERFLNRQSKQRTAGSVINPDAKGDSA